MEICITYGGMRHCFVIPLILIPIHWPVPGPGPVNYPQMFQDAMILATIRDLAKNAGDEKLREAINHGVEAGIHAMRQHAGADVAIRSTEARAD